VTTDGDPLLALFDVFLESSVEGRRKSDPRIYELVCERLGVPPEEGVFLDDVGANLKPARAMGMMTLEVETPEPLSKNSRKSWGSRWASEATLALRMGQPI